MKKNRIHYFNPTCELAVANGSFSYMPPLSLQKMEADLSILPYVFGSKNDFVITETIPSKRFSDSLINLGFDLPAFGSFQQLEVLENDSIAELCPWGWSPAAHFKFKNLKQKCTDGFAKSKVFNWQEQHKQLFERSTSLDFLTGLLENEVPYWFIAPGLIGQKANNFEEIEVLLKKHSSIVLKAPLSSSGRGIQIIRKATLNEPNRQWISGILKQQGYLIVEPFLEKLIDLSFQFYIQENSEIEYLGYSLFETNTNGQYKGTLIHPEIKRLVPNLDPDEINEKICISVDWIKKELKNSFYSNHYCGHLGIDAMLYRHQDGLMMQPCIEINCRKNMGILAFILEQLLHPEAKGKFQLFYGNTGDYLNFVNEQNQQNQPDYLDGKFASGFFSLTEATQETKFGAYITCR